MRYLIPFMIFGAALAGYQAARPQAPHSPNTESMAQVAASTYEHLATAIIEIEATEDELVKSVLIGYYTAAQLHLKAAGREAEGRAGHLEAAAAEVSNIANEGDKRIQAVRQRLAKAGHTHNTDVETKADYMFVTNRERKQLLDLASRIARAGENELENVSTDLARMFQTVIAPE